jgi:toxin ParE1/3/4
MQFHVTKKAEGDLDNIFVYWAQRAGIDVADKLIDSIEDRFAMLGDYPLIGRKCNEIAPGIRVFPTDKYLIYYQKERGLIKILHILHGARDQTRAFKNE